MDDIVTLHSGIQKTTDHLKSEFARLQTGRASASLVENVLVDAYGQKQPLKAVAGISIADARTITVQPWDKSVLQDVEKALTKADLGTSPVNEGTLIRIVLPPMTEERRKQLVKVVHELAEEARIAIRQQRQEVHTNAKKDESRSEDEHRDFETSVQKEVDKANAEIEGLAKKKEEEVMKV
jgi:ribosome recycling factor